jgi:hypothetical protein
MLGLLVAFIICLCLLLMDGAVFFLFVRLIVAHIPAKPLIYLDKIGNVGVEAVTNAIMARTGHWFKKPLTRKQEYAFSLCLLASARLLLGAVLRGCR